jgi:hypothetical protein
MRQRTLRRTALLSRAVLAGAALLLCRAAFAADDTLPAQIEQQVEDQEGLGLAPIAVETIQDVLASSAEVEAIAPELGAFQGENVGAGASLSSVIRSYDPQFNAAAALLKGEDFKRVPADARAPIEQKWGTVQSIRESLIAEAPGLDARQETALRERDRLDQEAAGLNKRKAELASAVADFNGVCHGTLPPAQYNACEARRGALLQAIAAHNANVAAYAQKAASWKSLRDALLAAIKTWGDAGEKWVAALKELVADADKEIAKAKTGTCTQSELDDRLDKAQDACKKLKECSESDPCPDMSYQLRKNRACHDAIKKVNECFDGKHPEYSKQEQAALKAVTTCEALFKKKCPDWDERYGKCTKEEHGALQAAVNAVCKVPRSCDPGKVDRGDCAELKRRLPLNLLCAEARDAINAKCYAGGEKNHREEAERARGSAQECATRIAAECSGPVGEPSEEETDDE